MSHPDRSTHDASRCWFSSVHPLSLGTYNSGRRIFYFCPSRIRSGYRLMLCGKPRIPATTSRGRQGGPDFTARLRRITQAALGGRPKVATVPLPPSGRRVQHLFPWAGCAPAWGQRCWTCQWWEKPLFKPMCQSAGCLAVFLSPPPGGFGQLTLGGCFTQHFPKRDVNRLIGAAPYHRSWKRKEKRFYL